jgi:hypothetical protein
MIRTRRTLAGLGALALALAVPAGLVLATEEPASAASTGLHSVITATPAAVAPGDPITLSMSTTFIDGSTQDDTSFTTFGFLLPSPDVGTCTGTVCTPNTVGTLTIMGNAKGAGVFGLSTTTTVRVLAPDHLVVNPVYTTASVGQTIAYRVQRAAADGTILDDVTSRATVTLGGAPCPAAVCTATTAGQQTMTATLDGMTAGGAVLVSRGAATHLVVTADSLVGWNNVWGPRFAAEAYDAGNNDLGDVTAATGGPHTVTATDGGLTGSLTANAQGPVPVIATTLPAGQVDVPYSASVLSSVQGATLTRPLVGVTPPPGLTLGTDGVLSGTPTAAGTYSMRIETFNDNGSNWADTSITIGLASPIPVPTPVPSPKPKVSVGGLSMPEGNSGRTTVLVPVRLSAASSTPVTVAWHTANGTAVAGKDYVAAHGTVTIPAGQLTATIPVSVIGDRVKERNETFTVVLTTPNGATLGTARGIVTIANDD